jgi:hypothetical protein
MFKQWIAVAALVLGFSAAANATVVTWEDPINFNPDILLTSGHSKTYTHDITREGFNPLLDDLYGYSLTVDLYDDSKHDGSEHAYIDVPSFFFNEGDEEFFNLSGNEFGGWSLLGSLILQATGRLTVTVSSLQGDFYLGGSTLTAWGNSHSTRSVPEPGTLALMGIVMVATGMTMRRRKRVR